MDSCKDTTKEDSHNELLKQFRKNLSDVLPQDMSDKVLLKWLRAKSFNLKKAEDNYRLNLRIRAVYNADNLEETYDVPEVIQKYTFSTSLGIAKDGTPIHYIAAGLGDFKGFIMSLDMYDIGKYCTMVTEMELKRCKEQSLKLGKEINEVTVIFDLDKFSIGKVFLPCVGEIAFDLFRLAQDFYPESWKNLLFVNAPFYFHTILNIFKPILRSTILEKVFVAPRSQSTNLLLEYIDAEEIPTFLGGTRADSSGDPQCSEFKKLGGVIPEKYYLCNRIQLLPTDIGVEEAWVPPKCCCNHVVIVRQANSILRVQLRTEGGSVSSVLLLRKFGPDPDDDLDYPGVNEYLDPEKETSNVQQISPSVHLTSYISPIDNYCLAPWPGMYIFRVYNSHWMKQKRCIFRVRILPPEV